MTETKARYIEAVGRRKTSIARVRATPSTKSSFEINDGKSVDDYFKTETQRIIAMEALSSLKTPLNFSITAKLIGGGVNSQAEALRHGISRILIKYDAELRKDLKKLGFLERDQRAKERRKFGLKKARKAPQWSKR
ncbi:MAG: 30S ribosomal protein S9 [Candidatus Paceibacterota bacterium]|nr:30S ribosomal protein S9 [Candidatus Paceibacterota bacterium]